jgi:tetratricopeptide (TPR) repeat protein
MSSFFAFLAVSCALTLGRPLGAQERPDALQSYRNGRYLEGQGRTTAAGEFYDTAVAICRNEIDSKASTTDTYVVMTWALRRQNKHDEVIRWAEAGIKAHGNDFRIIETMGEAYFYLNNYEASLRSMEQYVNALPQGDNASTAYFYIGEIYRALRKFRYADIAYTTAVRLEGGVAMWWYRLGLSREGAGDYQAAVTAYEQSLRLDPAYVQANEALLRSRTAVDSAAAGSA